MTNGTRDERTDRQRDERQQPIVAEALVPAPASAVFAYLGDLENHWELADRFIDVVHLDRAGGGHGGPAIGGVVRMRGPLGSRRTARTRVTEAVPPQRMRGRASVGRRTAAEVTWTLRGRGDTTLVRLEARIERAGWLDRALLRLGGRTWMRGRFATVLVRLARRFGAQQEPARTSARRARASQGAREQPFRGRAAPR